jgi:hypothetical protein
MEYFIMKLQNEKDPYDNDPNKGEVFEENGKRYFWSFSDAPVDSRDTSPKTAFAPHEIDPNSPISAPFGLAHLNVVYEQPTEPCVISDLGDTLVSVFSLVVCGMFYSIDQDLRCIDARDTPDGRITLWEDSFPLSGFEQQCLAFRSKSVKEYEELKRQAIQTRKAGEV